LLNARLGPGICYGLSIADDHRPEKAWQALHPGGKFQVQPSDDVDENPRPVFLLDTPRPLNASGGEPCLGGRLELLKGPERIDFGWWDETNQPARDYYIARQADGALFWIFTASSNDARAKRWYLHGIFS
ncbi:MAG TPA: hypothetical protein VJ998_00960, partial [Pseudomonadales bacterium]|nr:hypothetical protein [Pseudomonadales bacterium]